jgi:hypothetical protein
VRQQQADLARAYGIHGFCYYHYWFNGKRLLERPFHEVLASGEPDLPFCLCWANESWSRRWLGEEKAVLIAQEYSPEDDRRHAEWLVQAFEDPRYLRVAGRPVFLIYRPDHLPNPRATVEVLREVVTRAGLSSPWLVGVDAHRPGSDYRDSGFDATLGFEPQLSVLGSGCFTDNRSLAKLRSNWNLGIFSSQLKLYDDGEARRRMAGLARLPFVHPCCYVSWDNSPRRGAQGIVMVNGSPERFEQALKATVMRADSLPPEARLVFVNAWNEWAEGNHLEPDREHGHAYLDAVRRVVSRIDTRPSRSQDRSGRTGYPV